MSIKLPLFCHDGCPDTYAETLLPAFVMGIVNVTPDSFWEGSRVSSSCGAEKALRMIEEGADIVDIGGESSRPGAEYVEEQEEIRRIIPVVEEIRRYSQCPISVDTRKKRVLKAAHEAGADILNDISALEDDSEIGVYVAQENMPVILMHKRGIPKTMQEYTDYENPFKQVNDYLQARVEYALSLGIKQDRIIIDPGIGFGKDFETNRILITQCGALCNGNYPVLMALSRKICIGTMTGKDEAGRLAGTLAANLIAVQAGARLLRVHDVAETKDLLKVMEKLQWQMH